MTEEGNNIGDNDGDGKEEEILHREPFRLNLFETLDRSQSNHGIPHQDYAQYQNYCTARLGRLRRVKAVRPVLVHSHRYAEGGSKGSSGGGGSGGRRHHHAHCPRDEAPETIEHENVLWNLFYQSERAWAHGCALQQQQQQSAVNSNNNKKNPHPHVQRRLNKAARWANLLVGAASRSCDAVTVRECESYLAWTMGNASLERKRHADAYLQYGRALSILLDLAEGVHEDEEEREQERQLSERGVGGSKGAALALGDIWTTRAETAVRPLLRFCQHEARDELDADDLHRYSKRKGASPSSKTEVDDSIVIHFRGRDVALDSYKPLTVLYLKMEDLLLRQHSIQDESQFLQLLTDLDDAERWVQTEYVHYESLAAGPAVTARRRELSCLKGYFAYQKLSVWRRQQECRVRELTCDAEIVHVYTALQQNAQRMADLPAAAVPAGDGDGDGGAEDDLDLEEDPHWLEAQAHAVRIRAFRCYYLARLYERALGGTAQQVLALLERSSDLAKRALEEVAACEDDMEGANEYARDLEDLSDRRIPAMACRMEATLYLERRQRQQQQVSAASAATKTDRPLWLRLEDPDAGSVLADRPLLTIPMPCKPAFYDLAWPHVAGTSAPVRVLEEYIAASDDSGPERRRQAAYGGILSWLAGAT